MKKKVFLVQQGIWDMALESMPLAIGYMKAAADADESIRAESDIRLFNFQGSDSALDIVRRLLFNETPDVVGFSVLGWNFPRFGKVAETVRQFNKDAWIVFGGTHVTQQAERTFQMFPEVDIVVNHEGEFTFRDILKAYHAGKSKHDLGDIHGIAFKLPDGSVIQTPNRERINNLDDIPSPALSGAIPMLDANGNFRYDVALMETNRGCPYKCSFCYWGGAIGQKVRLFSIERLREEIEFYARHGVANIVLCDANFGMFKNDAEFMDVLIEIARRTGYPRSIETSWAKNKGPIFYDMVRKMRDHGFKSTFGLSLQSLTPKVLKVMQRSNMKLNDFEDLADWLEAEGLESYAELIWGTAEESIETFLQTYDRVARYTHRIATYTNLILPNTSYSENRDVHGFKLLRGKNDDFEYVLAHNAMTVQDNERMHRFLFWARVVPEHQVLRFMWPPLRELAGITQSKLLLSLDEWVDTQDDEIIAGLKKCRAEIVDNLNTSILDRALNYFYRKQGLGERLSAWWDEAVMPQVPRERAHFFRELFDYDWFTRPVLLDRRERDIPDYPVEQIDGAQYYLREATFSYDFPAINEKIRKRALTPADLEPQRKKMTLYFQVGFVNYYNLQEYVMRYHGMTKDMILADAQKRRKDVRAQHLGQSLQT